MASIFEALGNRISAAGAWVANRARVKKPKWDSISHFCEWVEDRVEALLEEYKDLGEKVPNITPEESKRMDDILVELRELGGAWNASGCRVMYGSPVNTVAPDDPTAERLDLAVAALPAEVRSVLAPRSRPPR